MKSIRNISVLDHSKRISEGRAHVQTTQRKSKGGDNTERKPRPLALIQSAMSIIIPLPGSRKVAYRAFDTLF